jgi:hypothetical protein
VENKFKKWFKRPWWRMTFFILTALRLRLFADNFLVILLALLFFLFLTSTRHSGDDGAEDIIIFKGWEPSEVVFNIFNWFLIVQ